MNHNSVYWKNSFPIIEHFMRNYGFSHVKLERLPYNRNDMLFRNQNSYVIFSLFDDYRDPCNTLGITLGVGELDNIQLQQFTSLPFSDYCNEPNSYYDIDRLNWKGETENVLRELAHKALPFLNGDQSKVIELAKLVKR